VQYKVAAADAVGPYISCELYVMNVGPHVYNVSDLKVRYYYTNEMKTPQWSLNWSHITDNGSSNQLVTVTEASTTLSPAAPGADTYLEFSFAPNGQQAIGAGQSIQFGWRLNAQNLSPQTQSNDYSFDGAMTTQADWSHVVLLHNGAVIWGTTP
jgi:endoglucanase